MIEATIKWHFLLRQEKKGLPARDPNPEIQINKNGDSDGPLFPSGI
jgi:hypothetical protein